MDHAGFALAADWRGLCHNTALGLGLGAPPLLLAAPLVRHLPRRGLDGLAEAGAGALLAPPSGFSPCWPLDLRARRARQFLRGDIGRCAAARSRSLMSRPFAQCDHTTSHGSNIPGQWYDRHHWSYDGRQVALPIPEHGHSPRPATTPPAKRLSAPAKGTRWTVKLRGEDRPCRRRAIGQPSAPSAAARRP
jgi:hypothetical protein